MPIINVVTGILFVIKEKGIEQECLEKGKTKYRFEVMPDLIQGDPDIAAKGKDINTCKEKAYPGKLKRSGIIQANLYTHKSSGP